MTRRHAGSTLTALVAVMAGTLVGACGKALDPAPAKMTVTQSVFTPVYRAAKAIEGAMGPGVTFVKFGELLQGLSTEIAIAKDQQMNEIDKRLIAKYDDLLSAYKFSAALWKKQIENSEDYWKGNIPVGFNGAISAELHEGVRTFKLSPVEQTMRGTGLKFLGLPRSSIQVVWAAAGDISSAATEMYYGRSDGARTAVASGSQAK
jgi:hypothetical protein